MLGTFGAIKSRSKSTVVLSALLGQICVRMAEGFPMKHQIWIDTRMWTARFCARDWSAAVARSSPTFWVKGGESWHKWEDWRRWKRRSTLPTTDEGCMCFLRDIRGASRVRPLQEAAAVAGIGFTNREGQLEAAKLVFDNGQAFSKEGPGTVPSGEWNGYQSKRRVFQIIYYC